MKRNTIIAIIALGGLVIAACAWVARYNGLLPVAAGAEAEAYDGLFNTILAIAFGFFLVVEGGLVYTLIRFRRKPNDDTDGLPIHENLTLELFWTAIPTVIVMWVAIYSFDVYTTMAGTSAMSMAHHHPTGHTETVRLASAQLPDGTSDATTNASKLAGDQLGNQKSSPQLSGIKLAGTVPNNASDVLAIDVSGMQFAWIFNYSDTISTGELHVPVGQRVRLNLSAVDVIHAFWVPQLRLKQDAIPGEPTYLEFTPTKVGEYPVICAELCGSYHGGMRTTMVIDTPEDYAKWLVEQEELAASGTKNVVAQANGALSPSQTSPSKVAPSQMHLHHAAAEMGLGMHLAPELQQQLHELH
ncbi:MAG: cytochrome c oxidase subunit II [Pseudanabaenaceae cyanobacterium]